MKQQLKERLGRLGPIRTIGRAPSGSPVFVVIRPEGALAKVKTIAAIHTLVRWGATAKAAKMAVEAMVERGEAVVAVSLPKRSTLAGELRTAGVAVTRIASLERADVKAIRETLGLSAEAFAARYGLNPRTVQGWEQGRPIDPTSNTYLHQIKANPQVVARALEEEVD